MRKMLWGALASCLLFVLLARAAPDGAQRAKELAELGHAAAPGNPGTGLELADKVARAQKAGDLYAQAFALSPEVAYAENAAGQYTRVFDWTNLGQVRFGLFKSAQVPALRQVAYEWLKRAMELGSGRSYTDYGALLLGEGNEAGALAAFEQGAAKNIAIAHFQLGMLKERSDKKVALAHYERALELGYKPARDYVYSSQIDVLKQYEPDLAVLRRGILRLKELHQEEDNSIALDALIREYNWRSFLVDEKERGERLPDFPLYLKVCALDKILNRQGMQDFYPGGYWSLHLSGADEMHPFQARGQVDRAGCAKLAKPLPVSVRDFLSKGGVAYLGAPTGNLVLDWKVMGKEIHLVPRPLEEQLDPID